MCYVAQMSGFCTGAVLASRGGAGSALKAGMVGGIILAVIEGLNIGMSRMFSNMGGPEEPTMAMAAGAGEAEQQDAAEQPWWAKLLPMPAAPPPDVDFSDPKEVRQSQYPPYQEKAMTWRSGCSLVLFQTFLLSI